jgi:tubulin polyglutamylase TTLL11
MQSIEDLIVQFLISLYPFLMYNFKAAYHKNIDKAKCFHILGFDIMLDEEEKPWLLEINANPSLNIDHEVLGKDGKPIT